MAHRRQLVKPRESVPQFAPTAKVPLPRFPERSWMHGLPIIRNVSKPHIYYCPKRKKWICGNYYVVHNATTPVYAYRGFARGVKSKASGYRK